MNLEKHYTRLPAKLFLRGNIFTPALLQGTSSAITEGIEDGVTNSLSPPRFSQLVSGLKSPNPLPLSLSLFFLFLPFSSAFTFWSAWTPRERHYEGLPPPDVIQSKKKKKAGTDSLSFVRCCISPHLWEDTAGIIGHLITLSKNGYRTAAVFSLERPDLHIEIQLKAVPYVFV